MPPPDFGTCSWAVPASVLSPATYEFVLNVSHARTGKWGSYLVRVVVAPKDVGPLPVVDIAPLGFPKHSPNAKLRLQAGAAYPDGSGGAFEYLWSSSPYLELANADISSTGSRGNNLVLLPGALAAGGLYRFTLAVTDAVSGANAFAALDVFVNSPPQGGGLYVAPTCGDVTTIDGPPLTLVAVAGANAGDEIFNTFGDHGNALLLHKYGFCEWDNAHGGVTPEQGPAIAAGPGAM